MPTLNNKSIRWGFAIDQAHFCYVMTHDDIGSRCMEKRFIARDSNGLASDSLRLIAHSLSG
jgi:hypothetical protein